MNILMPFLNFEFFLKWILKKYNDKDRHYIFIGIYCGWGEGRRMNQGNTQLMAHC